MEASLAVTSPSTASIPPPQVVPGVLGLGVLPTLTHNRLPQQDLKTALTCIFPQKSAPKPLYLEVNMRKQINGDVIARVLCPPQQWDSAPGGEYSSSPWGGWV